MIRRRGAMLLAALALAGCTVPVATTPPSGELLVLGPSGGFSATSLPPDWIGIGPAGDAPVDVALVDGVLALRAASGPSAPPAPVTLARRVQGPLLTTPYLRWGWWQRQGSPAMPLRLVVGFHGGDPARPSYTAEAPRWLGSELPPFDRVIELVWSNGGAMPPGTGGGMVRQHAVRTGIVGAGGWQLETIDLAAVYRSLWPDDDAGRARFMFIGVRLEPSVRPTTAAVAEIMLGR
ncbi:MAG: hypothetical protein WD270_05040 [Acetobacterales bacterium]